jgi:nicotinamidase-related amidase
MTAYTPLRPDNAALVMIDHQVNFMLACQTLPAEALRTNVIGLAKTAALYELPTITTGGYAADPLIPEIGGILKNRTHVDRETINSWETPSFVAAVKATGRKKLIMAGITTDLCLMYPALAAAAEGFEVYAVVDASGCWNSQIENAAIARLAMAGVQPINWGAVGGELQSRNWFEGNGPQMMGIYAQHVGPLQLMASVMNKHG